MSALGSGDETQVLIPTYMYMHHWCTTSAKPKRRYQIPGIRGIDSCGYWKPNPSPLKTVVFSFTKQNISPA